MSVWFVIVGLVYEPRGPARAGAASTAQQEAISL